ncbi:hypothetical protein B0I31_102279 [Saccharothrix carnea]|uniref:MFS transporter n=1 Tax=Saccharothrix carnea TaxID=1280637 RepID=A0A2P8IFQ9_SACCR|nr:hypothetical protein [Saccharothrix carnea]PSL57301.1 hypothetical protein B0I31_102279 [Saccharothrix carnea]
MLNALRVGDFRLLWAARAVSAFGTGTALSSANALNSVTDGVARLVGAPLGAALMALVGFHGLVLADVASYVVSAVLLALLSRHPSTAGRRGVGRELAEGFAFLRSDRTASALLVVSTAFLAANASLSALLVPFGLTAFGGTAAVGLALPAAVVIGSAGSAALVVTQTTLQRVTPAEVLGRVGAVLFTGEAAATFVGALVGPALAELTSARTTAYAACAVTVIAAVYATSTPSVHQPFAR